MLEIATAEPPILGLPRPWFFFALALPLGFAFQIPALGFMGWFLSSLPHELGHTIAAWYCGMPAFPAIRLDGHAVAVHQEQSAALAWCVALGLAALAVHGWRGGKPVRSVAFGAAALLLPPIAFTGARELWFLAAGHLGELTFGAICLRRALLGGHTHGDVERGLYALLGGHLVGGNVVLFFRLMTDAAAIDAYHHSGSLGLANDLVRIADDVADARIQAVAFGFLLLSLLAPIAAALSYLVKPEPDED